MPRTSSWNNSFTELPFRKIPNHISLNYVTLWYEGKIPVNLLIYNNIYIIIYYMTIPYDLFLKSFFNAVPANTQRKYSCQKAGNEIRLCLLEEWMNRETRVSSNCWSEETWGDKMWGMGQQEGGIMEAINTYLLFSRLLGVLSYKLLESLHLYSPFQKIFGYTWVLIHLLPMSNSCINT